MICYCFDITPDVIVNMWQWAGRFQSHVYYKQQRITLTEYSWFEP